MGPVEFVDILDSGVLLTREYDDPFLSVCLFHFAYNDGSRIELSRVKGESALDLAVSYWEERISCGDMPMTIVDVNGCRFERRWYTVKFKDPNSAPST